jgi:hypothetical protein
MPPFVSELCIFSYNLIYDSTKIALSYLVGRDGLTVYWFPISGGRNKLTVFEHIILETCLGTVEKKSMVCICGKVQVFAAM